MLSAPGTSTGTQPPAQVTVSSILRICVSSLQVHSDGSKSPFPGTWTPAPAANVRLRVCGRRRQSPASPPPWPRRGSLPSCPAAPIPPARCGNRLVRLAGASRPEVSNVAGSLRVPHRQGSCAQFPRRGRPQAAESGRASVRAAGLDDFSETFPLPIDSPRGENRHGRPPRRTPRRPLSSGGACPRGPTSRSSGTLQGSRLLPPLPQSSNDPQPRAFRKPSRLAGGQGTVPEARGTVEVHCRFRGSPLLFTLRGEVPPTTASLAVESRKPGQGRTRESVDLGVRRRARWVRGPRPFTSGRAQAVGLPGHRAPTALAAPSDLC